MAHCENNDNLGIRLVPVAREEGEGMTNPKRPRGFRENCSITPLQHKIYSHGVRNQHDVQGADCPNHKHVARQLPAWVHIDKRHLP